MTTPVALIPLEPGQRWVLHIQALVPALLLLSGGVAAGRLLQDQTGYSPWLVAVPAALVALWAIIVAPSRRFRSWGWAKTEDELHVAWGVWTHVHTIVPLSRVQHIDVAQGPLERTFGLARLIVHTAGTAHATVTLPGITRETAETLRDAIRDMVRAEPW